MMNSQKPSGATPTGANVPMEDVSKLNPIAAPAGQARPPTLPSITNAPRPMGEFLESLRPAPQQGAAAPGQPTALPSLPALNAGLVPGMPLAPGSAPFGSLPPVRMNVGFPNPPVGLGTSGGASGVQGVPVPGQAGAGPASPGQGALPTTPGTPTGGAVAVAAGAGGAAGAPGGAQPYRQVKFENALDFLDQVKAQFAKQPRVYNQFLDIMKDFKTQSIDTPGVIARVSELFKGHKNLIGGFNTFLPPGYKIEVPEDSPPAAATRPRQAAAGAAAAAVAPPAPPAAAAPRKQPEFDHARNYVKKIKLRFALQPHIYKSFLEILHTYHKEQHTIKDVYDQVANLFQNHPDLLEEFTQFLPDPIQPGAGGAAAAAGIGGGRGGKQTRPRPKGPAKPAPAPAPAPEPEDRRGMKRRKDEKEDKFANGTPEEMALFSKIKQKISGKRWNEFLKCLNLFNQEIIARVELCILVRDLLGKHHELFDKFRTFLGVAESMDYSDGETKLKSSSAWLDIDFSTCKRCGPSYRALPKSYPPPTCSGRTELCQQVLNDLWVSVPTGSEDGQFKNSRKNQYEEVLFKCEDDRYELDLVIELNTSTIRVLEPIAKRIEETAEADRPSFRIDAPLDVLHVRSIERIYGDKGADIIDGLHDNPTVAVPVILRRLKQKDQEWRKARREWNKIWREVNEKNYHKSLDHQSFYFKQNEKKALAPKVLIAEVKQKYQETIKDGRAPAAVQHMSHRMADERIFKEMLELLNYASEKLLPKNEKDKIETFLTKFMGHFFKAEALPAVDDAAEDAAAAAASAYTPSPLPAGTPAAGESHPKTGDEEKDKAAAAKPMETDKKPDQPPAPAADADVQKGESKVKPVVTKVDGAAATPAPAAPAVEKKARVCFGNSSFYVLFRLYQILYERIHRAHQLSRAQLTKWAPPPKKDPNTGQPEKPAEPKAKFAAFVKSLYSFVAGSLDQQKYEDELREQLGIASYVLFTMDKLVFQIIKQIQSILSDDACQKLVSLYQYEDARAPAPVEAVYHTNAVEILGEERCYRFEFEHAPKVGFLHIRLLDAANQPRFMELSFNKDKWAQYVDNYAGSEVRDLDVRKHHIFLLRNTRKNVNTPQALENTELLNGLECKICLSTYKMFYVEDTEDLFHRWRPRTAAVRAARKTKTDAVTKQRLDKFHQWHTKRLAQLPA